MSRLRWETAAGLSVVALLTALCLAPAAWAGPRVTLTSPHAFQVVLEADYVDADCFAKPRGPLVVPARTFLSQLL